MVEEEDLAIEVEETREEEEAVVEVIILPRKRVWKKNSNFIP